MNYGAVLQCYALQSVLQSKGYDVDVVDYRQLHTEKIYSTFNISIFFGKIRSCHFKDLIIYILNIKNRWDKINKFKKFTTNYLMISRKCFKSALDIHGYDRYIIGSDQLWNPICTGGYDPIYWGNFDSSKKKTTYAISTNVPILKERPVSDIIRDLKNFEHILCREAEVANYIKSLGNKNVDVSIDPTLLLNQHEWLNIVNRADAPSCKYILTYSVRGDKRILSNIANNLVKDGLQILNINGNITPQEFVSLIYHADCVITSSFHATVFSVIFQRPFWSVKYGDAHDLRYVNLLVNLGLQKQLVSKDFVPYIPIIDFGYACRKLQELRNDSIDKLINSFD